MDYSVGAILEGTVKSITGFGAFISLPDNKTGLVHISEVSSTYVNDIHTFLTVGQTVQVKVLSIDPAGRISLSIKQAQERPARPERPAPRVFTGVKAAKPAPDSFEEKLKQFISDSDSKIAGSRQYEHKTRNRKR